LPVVATAGHVDHGKSTLVRALTGIDPDRWAEEKERGLTIDLGFAWCTLPTAGDVGFVDVPGHIRFISNMLAGVGAVDACLFVVATTEGWKPQSEEHLRILDVLGVARGVIALTMAGLVDADAIELARLDVADRVTGTFLADAEVVAVDAPTGVGLDALTAALDRVVSGAPAASDIDRPRLWVDRAFAARGAGTVVTGTLTGGSLAIGDELTVEPAGAPVRVRALQSHQQTHQRIGPGRRVAVNLSGIAHADVKRGDALVRAGQWVRANTLDCALHLVPGLDHEVSRRGAYHAHIGSGQYTVKMRLLDGGAARLHLPVPLPLVMGDRYVLRESGRGETIGGGEILDVSPVLTASKARPDRAVDRVITERGWVDVGELERLTGEKRTPTVGHWAVSPEALAATCQQVRRALPVMVTTLDDQQRAALETLDGVVVENGRAQLATEPSRDWSAHPYLAALLQSPFAPPEPDGVDRAELRELVRRGLVVERDGYYFAAAAVDAAARRVAELLATSPDGVTVAEVRDALDSTRKHVLPLLAQLDATGVTRRRGDLRVAGPRLPA
jgi:selenocysteine-specific elongation factor